LSLDFIYPSIGVQILTNTRQMNTHTHKHTAQATHWIKHIAQIPDSLYVILTISTGTLKFSAGTLRVSTGTLTVQTTHRVEDIAETPQITEHANRSMKLPCPGEHTLWYQVNIHCGIKEEKKKSKRVRKVKIKARNIYTYKQTNKQR
jgi:hypothetical protein